MPRGSPATSPASWNSSSSTRPITMPTQLATPTSRPPAITGSIITPSRPRATSRSSTPSASTWRPGVPIESTKGEWGRGQHEVNFVYNRPLEMADGHMVFKQGAKEIAEANGKSVSFMPKIFVTEQGTSCHMHISIARDGKNLFDGQSKYFRQFLAGLMRYSRELCYFFAPTINAYKRYQPGSWAPTKMAWAMDNRTTGFRIVGNDQSFRIENRMPGGDANPYLAFAAMIAAGIAGVEENL